LQTNPSICITKVEVVEGLKKDEPANSLETRQNIAINNIINKTNEQNDDPSNDRVPNREDFMNNHPLLHVLHQFGFAFIAGLCTAYFLKKTLKFMTFVAGGFSLILQYLSYRGLITIHWENFTPNLSLKGLLEIIGYQSTGFMLGFFVGMRKQLTKALQPIKL